MDQSLTSSCTAHAWSAAMYTTSHAQAIAPIPWVPSQKGLYAATRCVQRAASTPGDAPLPPLTDQGAMLGDVITAISTVGIRPRRQLDPDDRNSDIDPATVNDEPTLGELEEEAQTMIVSEYFLDEAAPDFEEQLAATLEAGIACTATIWVDTKGPRSVEGWDPATGALGAPDTSDPHGGWHDIEVSYYRTNADGSRTFGGLNSWGHWGTNGDGHWEGDSEFVRGMRGVVAATVRRAT